MKILGAGLAPPLARGIAPSSFRLPASAAAEPRERVQLGSPGTADEAPPSSGLLRRLGLAAGLAVSLLGTISPALAGPLEAGSRAGTPTVARTISQDQEVELLGGKDRPGRLERIAEGNSGHTVFTVHGINGAPDVVQPLSQRAADQGHEVQTFVYDDQYRRLEDSSRDLADSLRAWMEAHPGEPLEIHAHSMGTRVSLGALDLLNQEGRLTVPVDLHLVAPPLGGYAAANMARMSPGFLGSLIAGVRPGVDMGTTSDFQARLEALNLPSNVRTTIYMGTQDTVVDHQMPGFHRISNNLGARLVTVDGADHINVVTRVATLQDKTAPTTLAAIE